MMQRIKIAKTQLGFSLVEIMVGLVIGLLASLVILQIFATFEGQKRTTTGNSDAQTNGGIALFTMVRDIQSAGFGLPMFDTVNSALKCNPALSGSTMTVDHDKNSATPVIDMFPISIVDGGAGSDTILVRYSADGANAKGGMGVKVISKSGNDVNINNNLGCANNDVVLLANGPTCTLTTVNDTTLAAPTTQVTLTSGAAAVASAGSLACMGQWNQFTYTVANSQLQRNDARNTNPTPIVSDIVNIQAQYGISLDPKDNQISLWVTPTAGGVWASPGVTSATCSATIANRNCIKAVRIAIVARNGLLEKTSVSTACTSTNAADPKGVCAWEGTVASPAPSIDLSGTANWDRYRYRVYSTIIPLRNMIWSKKTI